MKKYETNYYKNRFSNINCLQSKNKFLSDGY